MFLSQISIPFQFSQCEFHIFHDNALQYEKAGSPWCTPQGAVYSGCCPESEIIIVLEVIVVLQGIFWRSQCFVNDSMLDFSKEEAQPWIFLFWCYILTWLFLFRTILSLWIIIRLNQWHRFRTLSKILEGLLTAIAVGHRKNWQEILVWWTWPGGWWPPMWPWQELPCGRSRRRTRRRRQSWWSAYILSGWRRTAALEKKHWQSISLIEKRRRRKKNNLRKGRKGTCSLFDLSISNIDCRYNDIF